MGGGEEEKNEEKGEREEAAKESRVITCNNENEKNYQTMANPQFENPASSKEQATPWLSWNRWSQGWGNSKIGEDREEIISGCPPNVYPSPWAQTHDTHQFVDSGGKNRFPGWPQQQGNSHEPTRNSYVSGKKASEEMADASDSMQVNKAMKEEEAEKHGRKSMTTEEEGPSVTPGISINQNLGKQNHSPSPPSQWHYGPPPHPSFFPPPPHLFDSSGHPPPNASFGPPPFPDHHGYHPPHPPPHPPHHFPPHPPPRPPFPGHLPPHHHPPGHPHSGPPLPPHFHPPLPPFLQNPYQGHPHQPSSVQENTTTKYVGSSNNNMQGESVAEGPNHTSRNVLERSISDTSVEGKGSENGSAGDNSFWKKREAEQQLQLQEIKKKWRQDEEKEGGRGGEEEEHSAAMERGSEKEGEDGRTMDLLASKLEKHTVQSILSGEGRVLRKEDPKKAHFSHSTPLKAQPLLDKLKDNVRSVSESSLKQTGSSAMETSVYSAPPAVRRSSSYAADVSLTLGPPKSTGRTSGGRGERAGRRVPQKAISQSTQSTGSADPRLVKLMMSAGLSEYTGLLVDAWVDMDELPRLSLEEFRKLGLSDEVSAKLKKALEPPKKVDAEMVAFMDSLGLAQFIPLLADSWVDMKELRNMEEKELLQLGLAIGPVKRLLRGLAREKKASIGTPLPSEVKQIGTSESFTSQGNSMGHGLTPATTVAPTLSKSNTTAVNKDEVAKRMMVAIESLDIARTMVVAGEPAPPVSQAIVQLSTAAKALLNLLQNR